MTAPNPYAQYAQPAPTQETTPPPITVSPTQNPATVSPTVADPAAQYQAWLASRAAAAQAAPAPVAPPAPPVAPPPPAQPVDPAYAAWLASQQAAPAAPPVAPPAFDPAAAYAAYQAAQQQTPSQFVAPPRPGAAPSAGTDPFDDPAPPRPKGPRLDDMYGRLLLIIPKGMDKGKSTETDGTVTTYDRMTADVIVLDGPPMPYGGKPNGRPPTPHDRVAEIPHREVGMYVSAKALISQSRDAWAKRQRNEPGMVLGRLNYGEQPADPKLQAPWVLDKATDADRALARAYLATIDPFA